ncbi:hypothetical protein LIER_02015 [Lithospermum erythrorhizon]|uniref:MULE transposase domain-containing protein n=1 Tax=Lithospermum erythrorhizon TaxID=34254 RepID=A0AAV3NNN8_LITER
MSTKHKNCPQQRTILGNNNFLVVAFEDILRVMPNIKIPALQVVVKKKFSIRISTNIVKRTKDSARRNIKGDHVGQFNRFKRIYVCLWPLVKGFKIGCGRLIGLDGCHTKGIHKQQLLSAVLLDSNNGWWPIDWAIVEQENGATWRWFLKHLFKDLGETSRAATRKKAAHKKGNVATKTKVTAPRKRKTKLHERIRGRHCASQ